MRPRAVTILLFLLFFGVSRESHAFLEWLHKLSGPGPFLGLKVVGRFHCAEFLDCNLVEIGGGTGFLPKRPKWTGSVVFGADFSYKNDLDYTAGIDPPRVWIWSLEPSVERWLTADRDIFVGLGYALNEFQGRVFEDFRRDAWVVRAGHRWERKGRRFHAWELGVRYLIFEDRFTPQEFGALPGPSEERGVAGLFARAYFWEKK